MSVQSSSWTIEGLAFVLCGVSGERGGEIKQVPTWTFCLSFVVVIGKKEVP